MHVIFQLSSSVSSPSCFGTSVADALRRRISGRSVSYDGMLGVRGSPDACISGMSAMRATLLGLETWTRLRRLQFSESTLSHDSLGSFVLVSAATRLGSSCLRWITFASSFQGRHLSHLAFLLLLRRAQVWQRCCPLWCAT